MPRTAQTPLISTRLARDDNKALDDLARVTGKSKTEILREAVRFYLQHLTNQQDIDRQTLYAKELKKNIERLIKIFIPMRTDVATLMQITYNRCEPDEYQAARTYATQRIRKHIADTENKLSAGAAKVVLDDSQA